MPKQKCEVCGNEAVLVIREIEVVKDKTWGDKKVYKAGKCHWFCVSHGLLEHKKSNENPSH